MDSSAKTAWAASIIGGTIAAAVGGIITFHYSNLFKIADKSQMEQLETHAPAEANKSPDAQLFSTDHQNSSQVSGTGNPIPQAEEQKSAIGPNQCGASVDVRFTAIQKIYTTSPRDTEWTALVTTLIGCDDFNRALIAAGSIYYTTTRDSAYEQIVNALIKKKPYDFALKVIDLVYYAETRDRLSRRLIAATQ
jgi:hypothetical protein